MPLLEVVRAPRTGPQAVATAVALGKRIGKTVIVNSGCSALAEGLRGWGYEPVAVELDEFLKAGGSAKCLTLRLDGEDAAVWD